LKISIRFTIEWADCYGHCCIPECATRYATSAGFKKMDIHNWMMAVIMMVDKFLNKSELLAEVKCCSSLAAYKIGEHSKNYGHQIIQLPLYYSNINLMKYVL
jgi:hypothetical protein